MGELISIIIPVYNLEEYVERTVKSVLSSTYCNIEIICINDGSTDNSLDVLRRLAKTDERVKVLDKPNGGVTSARLLGLENAKGEWITFVDGDDTIDSDMYERLLANTTADIDISHCGYKKVLPNDEVEYYYNSGKKIEQSNKQGLYDLLAGDFIEPGLVNKLYHRNLFAGLLDWLNRDVKINEDLLMNFYLFRNARKSIYEDFCPYHYIVRVGSASASQVNVNKLYDPIRVMDILVAETQNDEVLQGVVQSRLSYLLINACAQGDQENKELVKEFRRYTLGRLRKSLKAILHGKECTKKRKITALWASIWPSSYRWVHRLYVRKKYKKYKEIYPWF